MFIYHDINYNSNIVLIYAINLMRRSMYVSYLIIFINTGKNETQMNFVSHLLF